MADSFKRTIAWIILSVMQVKLHSKFTIWWEGSPLYFNSFKYIAALQEHTMCAFESQVDVHLIEYECVFMARFPCRKTHWPHLAHSF